MTKMHNRANIGRPGAVATTAGLLLAFASAIWWQGRHAGYDEQRALQGLKKEFSTAHTVLARQLAEHLQNLESLEELLQIIESQPSSATGSVAVTTLLASAEPVPSNLGGGELYGRPGSADPDMLTNVALRAKLSAWSSAIGEVQDDQEIAAKMVDEVYMPYFMNKNVVVGEEVSESQEASVMPEQPLSSDPDAISQVLADPKFHVLVAGRLGFQRHLITELENAIAAAENVVAELDKSID